MSALSKRYVLEELFRRLLSALSDEAILAEALDKSDGMARHVKQAIKTQGQGVKMTTVNEALKNDPFRAAAWKLLGLPQDTPFPSLPGELLYGDLSIEIHSPALKDVYLSDENMESRTSKFFMAAAEVLGRSIMSYGEGAAALGEKLHRETPGNNMKRKVEEKM